jgi:hypothetical protein
VVDDHTLENISHSGKRISPPTSSQVIFFFQDVLFVPSCELGRSRCYFPVRQSSAREGVIAEGDITAEGVITI